MCEFRTQDVDYSSDSELRYECKKHNLITVREHCPECAPDRIPKGISDKKNFINERTNEYKWLLSMRAGINWREAMVYELEYVIFDPFFVSEEVECDQW